MAAISVKAGYTVEATAVDENTTEYSVAVDKKLAQVRIGDVYYTTLGNANVNANNGDTITVLKDVTGLSTIYISKELTIDLNGHLVQGKRTAGSYYPNGPIIRAYSDETKLVIVDSSEAKSGKIENTAASGCAVFAYKGTVEIKGGAFAGKDAAVVASDTAAIYTFDAVRCELVDDVSLSKTSFTYNGKTQTPSVTVKTADGTTLKNGDAYTVSYKGNRISVGTHTVNVYCKGSYEGEISKTYTINPAKPGIKKIKSSKRKMTVYMTSKPGSKGAKAYRIYYKQKGTSTWKSTTTTSSYKTIKGLKKGKRYYVKVYAYTGSYKSAYSSTKLSSKIR